jgi:hypothetical protein
MTAGVQQCKGQICQCTYFVDLSLCAHAHSRECAHFHPFAASIEIAQGANSGQICQCTLP